MTSQLSFDRSAVDDFQAAEFLDTLKAIMENPKTILLGSYTADVPHPLAALLWAPDIHFLLQCFTREDVLSFLVVFKFLSSLTFKLSTLTYSLLCVTPSPPARHLSLLFLDVEKIYIWTYWEILFCFRKISCKHTVSTSTCHVHEIYYCNLLIVTVYIVKLI